MAVIIFAFGKTSQGLFKFGKIKLQRNEVVVEASSNMRDDRKVSLVKIKLSEEG